MADLDEGANENDVVRKCNSVNPEEFIEKSQEGITRTFGGELVNDRGIEVRGPLTEAHANAQQKSETFLA